MNSARRASVVLVAIVATTPTLVSADDAWQDVARAMNGRSARAALQGLDEVDRSVAWPVACLEMHLAMIAVAEQSRPLRGFLPEVVDEIAGHASRALDAMQRCDDVGERVAARRGTLEAIRNESPALSREIAALRARGLGRYSPPGVEVLTRWDELTRGADGWAAEWGHALAIWEATHPPDVEEGSWSRASARPVRIVGIAAGVTVLLAGAASLISLIAVSEPTDVTIGGVALASGLALSALAGASWRYRQLAVPGFVLALGAEVAAIVILAKERSSFGGYFGGGLLIGGIAGLALGIGGFVHMRHANSPRRAWRKWRGALPTPYVSRRGFGVAWSTTL